MRKICLVCATVLAWMTIQAGTYYVDARRPNDSGNGLGWATAKKTIQAAVNTTVGGDTVLVTNGIYTTINVGNTSIRIQSVNGASFTFIDGAGTTRCATLGSDSYSHTNTVLSGFTLRNGWDMEGGASYAGTLNNCLLTGNSAIGFGGGSYGGVLNNCVLTGNSVSYYGGGSCESILNNCTLADNSADVGGGSYLGTLNNCIVWDNFTPDDVFRNYLGRDIRYSCTSPLPEGEGNIAQDPLLMDAANGDCHLRPGSPCLDAGLNAYAVGDTDITGTNRIQNGNVDMGAYEGTVKCFVISVCIQGIGLVSPMTATTDSGGAASFTATPQGRPFVCYMTNGVFASSSTNFTWRNITADGSLTAIFQAYNWYVDGTRPHDFGDGLSWGTAKRTLQSAIDSSIPRDTIIVANGIYEPVTTGNKFITIKSLNGKEAAIIDGGGITRCATLGSSPSSTNTVLSGFTLQNGWANEGGGSYGGTLNNCALTDNSANYYGGGSYGGTLNNCTLTDNTSEYGGGSSESTLNNCTLADNSAYYYGGGSHHGTLNNCIVWDNISSYDYFNNYYYSELHYSCTFPLPAGEGNIAHNPRLTDATNGDFRLRSGSPCLDAGLNTYVVGGTDITGANRIQNGQVDLGALEGVIEGFVIAVRIQGIGQVSPMTAVSSFGGTGCFTAILQGRPFICYMTNGVFASSSTNFIWENISADGELTALFQICEWRVDASRPNDTGDGLSWGTAKRTIQSAVDNSLPGDTIIVADGVYAPVFTGDKAVTIRSLNGKAASIIDGGGSNRCVTLGSSSFHTKTVLSDFTLRNGTAESGGGSCYGTLNNCIHIDNSARFGGGSYGGILNNCLLTGNSATSGGGSSASTLNNCTLAGNSADQAGGSYNCTLNNCIVWYNLNEPEIYYSKSRNSCVKQIFPGYYDHGGNIFSDPLFVDAVNSDFRLQPASPCINAGTNELVAGSVDLDGNPRIYNGRVEMGAYEFMMTQNTSVPVPFSWLDLFYPGLTDINAYESTASSTGANSRHVWESYIAGLNPTNPSSQFTANISISNAHHLITWAPDLRPGRIYTVLGKTNLTDTAWSPTNNACKFFKVKVAMP